MRSFGLLIGVALLSACDAGTETDPANEPEEIREETADAMEEPSALAPRGEQRIAVQEEVELDEDADTAWARIGDEACDLQNWLPGVDSCELASGTDGTVGAVRALNGGAVVEEFTAWDNAGRTHTYRMTEGPFAQAGYEATVSVAPRDGGGSVAVWQVEAAPAEDALESTRTALEGMVAAGMSSLGGGE